MQLSTANLKQRQNSKHVGRTQFGQKQSKSDPVLLVQCATRYGKLKTETENSKHRRHGFSNLKISDINSFLLLKICQHFQIHSKISFSCVDPWLLEYFYMYCLSKKNRSRSQTRENKILICTRLKLNDCQSLSLPILDAIHKWCQRNLHLYSERHAAFMTRKHFCGQPFA